MIFLTSYVVEVVVEKVWQINGEWRMGICLADLPRHKMVARGSPICSQDSKG